MSLTHKTALMVAIFTMANVAVGFGIHRALVAPEFAARARELALQCDRKTPGDAGSE